MVLTTKRIEEITEEIKTWFDDVFLVKDNQIVSKESMAIFAEVTKNEGRPSGFVFSLFLAGDPLLFGYERMAYTDPSSAITAARKEIIRREAIRRAKAEMDMEFLECQAELSRLRLSAEKAEEKPETLRQRIARFLSGRGSASNLAKVILFTLGIAALFAFVIFGVAISVVLSSGGSL